jgi:hypothetical protein
MIVAASVVLWWLGLPVGIEHQSEHPDYPRERQIMMAVKLGEELGWWAWTDMFGMLTDHYVPQPPVHEESHVMALHELVGHQQVGEIRRKTQVEEILGG